MQNAVEALPGDLRRIAEVAGIEAALKIASVFRGNFLYIPGLYAFERAARDEEMRRDYDSGVPVRRIAQKHSLTVRAVRKILNRPVQDVYPEILLKCKVGI